MRWLCFILVILMLPLPAQADTLEQALADDTIIRLHVIAHSNSPEDQGLKLLVRDALLERFAPALSECASSETARAAIEALLPQMETCARDTLQALGFAYPVSITFGQEVFPTRDYAGVRVPAGTYNALCVRIGSADGQNWWCVMYPPLCLLTPDMTEAALAAQPSQAADNQTYPFESAFMRWLRTLPFWHKEESTCATDF